MSRAWLALCALGVAAAHSGPGPGEPPFVEGRASETRVRGLPDLSKLAASVLPAVVGVLTVEDEQAPFEAGDPLKDVFDRFRGDGPRKGLATGFVIHPDGYIVTNAHVVKGASRIQVELGEDEERIPASVVGQDESTDVALLKVDAGRPLPVLPLGSSDRLQIAEWVMVVGNPFGLSHTVTLGIVSQIGRTAIAPVGRDGYYDFIQTDAPINPGSSGGPLVNMRGEVVGIATAINATGQGIGFAVPIDMAKQILGQLREHGHVIRSWMGISVREQRGRPPAGSAPARELLVTDVVNGGPAAAGGLRSGDVITECDGRHVSSAARLRWYVATAGVGRNVDLTVRRGGAERSVHVRLKPLPDAGDAAEEAKASARVQPVPDE
jgi:serine protease Do